MSRLLRDKKNPARGGVRKLMTILPLPRRSSSHVPALVDLGVTRDTRAHVHEPYGRARGNVFPPLVHGRKRDTELSGDGFLVAAESIQNV
jgi:hypothetical protein